MKFVLAAAAAPAVFASPISKVIELISNLEGKIIQEGEAAQKIFAKSSELCEDRNRDLSHEIEQAKASVEELNAKIEEAVATGNSASAKEEDLAAEISKDEADLKAATKVRENEAKDFAAEQAELTETISMLERAVAVLEREMSKGEASLVQAPAATGMAEAFEALVKASELKEADANKLSALIQGASTEMSDESDAGAPASAVYQSKSGGIVQTLEDLKAKAEAQLEEARKTEQTNLHNFQMLRQSLNDEIKFALQDKANAQNSASESAKAKATAEGELASTQKALAADDGSQNDLHRDCMSKAQDFEAEVKSRGEELKALASAKKEIKDKTGNADSFAYSQAQVKTTASFLQLGAVSMASRLEVVRMVRNLARRTESAALTQLAVRMSSANHGEDPFSKIKGLISNMIEKLETESSEDASKKQYCDKELAESTDKSDEKTAAVNKLNNHIDVATSRSAKLKEQVAALQESLAKLTRSQAQMDQLRSEENSAFKKNQADLTQGLDGVKTALKILTDYYAKDAAHESASGASTGIIGMIEVVESDLTKSLAEVQTTEETAASAYEQETKDNELEKATKTKSVEYKTAETVSLKKDISEASTDRSAVQEELDAITEYLSKIKQECTDVAMSYEERKKRQEQEIAGLKEALQVLEEETASFLQRGTTHRRKSSGLFVTPSLRGA